MSLNEVSLKILTGIINPLVFEPLDKSSLSVVSRSWTAYRQLIVNNSYSQKLGLFLEPCGPPLETQAPLTGDYKEMSSILANQIASKCGGGWSCGISASQWVQLYTGAQINFGDLTPYLNYVRSPNPTYLNISLLWISSYLSFIENVCPLRSLTT